MIKFNYLNHNGKLSERQVEPECIEFLFHSSFGYQPGWFLSGFDLEKQARRSFALNRIVFAEQDDYFRIPKAFTLWRVR